jgi:S-(hydroxymethyl)glutathione dehydrogenase/alcohol dehydrogenase
VGVGIIAFQGARHAGADVILAVGPVPFRRDQALKSGATHDAKDFDEAMEALAPLTDGRT